MIIQTVRNNKKTTLLFGLYFVILLSVSLKLINVYSDIYKQEYVLVHDNLERINMLHQLKSEASLILLSVQGAFITKNINNHLDSTKTHIQNYAAISEKLLDEDAPETRIEISSIGDPALIGLKKVVSSLEKNNLKEGFAIFEKLIHPSMNSWIKAIDKSISFETINNGYAFENIHQQQDLAARICIVIAILVCPLLTITLAFFIF